MKEHRQLVFDKMIECIVKGVFRPNDKLYSENRLARILGVSRNDVREVMIALELMGVVKNVQGKGSYLTQFELSEAANPFSLMIMLKQGNPDEIMQVRRMLEPEITRLCVTNIKKKNIDELEIILQNLENSTDSAFCAKEDALFHSIIASVCGNKLLQTLMNMIFGYISYVSLNNWLILTQPENIEDKKQIIKQHYDVLVAIKQGDVDKAVLAMHTHLNYIVENLNQVIKEEFLEYEKQKSISWP